MRPIEDSLQFHVRFEPIHSFQDGNGRVDDCSGLRKVSSMDMFPLSLEMR
ncbi:TPA: Fic family protein [Streptococcus suis]